MHTALLRTVSHDLRSPLAAATAAISGLRAQDIELAAADRDELLDTAEESLEVVSRLAASLLDLTRLQAGARSVFPRPADLGEIIVRALAGLGSQSRAVRVNLPSELPAVLADPPLMERVIANLIGNALRYSPDGAPPLLTARAQGGRVELRVADRGPGVPPADWDRMFVPFQRLGATEPASGIGLGLAVSRGLTQAMHGTLEPDETPGGGLTMIVSVPAAPRPAWPAVTAWWPASPSPDRRELPDDHHRRYAS
jgi:two-component system sensor histidine kinase KdpD